MTNGLAILGGVAVFSVFVITLIALLLRDPPKD